MAENGILSAFSASDVAQFSKDFSQLLRVGAEIDRYYGKSHHDLDFMLPKFEKLIELFNKKYKGLKLKTRKTVEHCKTRLFVKERDVKQFFADSASKIPGLKAVGRSSPSQVEVSNVEEFARFLDSLLDKIQISYLDPEAGTSTVSAVLDRSEKMLEILYELKEITNENSASFKIAAFYALKEGANKKIDIYGEAATFGFANLLDEVKKRDWYDKFNPKFLE